MAASPLNNYFDSETQRTRRGPGFNPSLPQPEQPLIGQPQTPEATQAMNRGGVSTAVQPPITPPPAQAQPSYQDTNRGTAQSAVLKGPPLTLYGRPPQDQARILSQWLTSQGVTLPTFPVGGTSRVDPQINALIDRINNPATSPQEQAALAHELGALIGQRQASLQGPASFSYDPTMQGPSQPRTPQTANELVGGLYNPSESTPGQITSGVRPLLRDFIMSMNQGGAASDEQRRIATSRIKSGSEGALATRKQQLADTLSRAGLYGGQAQDRLTQLDVGALGEQTNALQDLELALIDRQQQAKQSALSALLGEAGLEQSDIAQQRSLQQQRQLEQARLAAGQSQFTDTLGFQGDQARIQAELTQRAQDIGLILQLLQLAAAGDENAAQRALALLSTLGTA